MRQRLSVYRRIVVDATELLPNDRSNAQVVVRPGVIGLGPASEDHSVAQGRRHDLDDAGDAVAAAARRAAVLGVLASAQRKRETRISASIMNSRAQLHAPRGQCSFHALRVRAKKVFFIINKCERRAVANLVCRVYRVV